MIRFSCPICNSDVKVDEILSGATTKCGCGELVRVPTINPFDQPIQPNSQLKQSKVVCPQCGHEDWKSLSLIYEQGTQAIGIGTIGISSGGGLGVASSLGSSVTTLASRACPPSRMVSHHIWFVLAVIFIAIDAGLFFWNVLVGTIFLIVPFRLLFLWLRGDERTRIAHQNAMQQWKNSKACMRCGTFFK